MVTIIIGIILFIAALVMVVFIGKLIIKALPFIIVLAVLLLAGRILLKLKLKI